MGLVMLCSLPSSYTNFRDAILYGRDTLTLNEVYETLHYKEKMKPMMSHDGSSHPKPRDYLFQTEAKVRMTTWVGRNPETSINLANIAKRWA